MEKETECYKIKNDFFKKKGLFFHSKIKNYNYNFTNTTNWLQWVKVTNNLIIYLYAVDFNY